MLNIVDVYGRSLYAHAFGLPVIDGGGGLTAVEMVKYTAK